MAEYIDKERLKQCFHANICGENAYDELIDMQPTADVIEREKIDKVVKEIKELYAEWENISEEAKLESNPFGAVLNILQRNIGGQL